MSEMLHDVLHNHEICLFHIIGSSRSWTPSLFLSLFTSKSTLQIILKQNSFFETICKKNQLHSVLKNYHELKFHQYFLFPYHLRILKKRYSQKKKDLCSVRQGTKFTNHAPCCQPVSRIISCKHTNTITVHNL
jgi:hypothetical protein